MEEKKITKKEYYTQLKAIVEKSETANKSDMLAFIEHEIELLENKSKKSNNKVTEENKAIAKIVVDILSEIDSPVTLGGMLKDTRLSTFATISGNPVTTQKLTPIVTNLVEVDKTVVRVREKGANYYSIA